MLIMTNILACLFLEATIPDYTLQTVKLEQPLHEAEHSMSTHWYFYRMFRDVAKRTEFTFPS